MIWNSVDNALRGLFNVAAKSPQSVKEIFFKDGYKVDSRSIRHTIDYDNSRIPAEAITLARNTLYICHSSIDEHMESLFFLYHYGYLKEYESQLLDGLMILCDIRRCVVEEALLSFTYGDKANIEKHVTKDDNFNQVEYQIKKVRKQLNEYRGNIWGYVEETLINAGYLKYYEEIT